MVTIPQSHRRLHLKAHRKSQGISAPEMGEKLGIERESVLRQEREWWRVKPPMQLKWAAVLGCDVEDLWSPPPTKPATPTIARAQSLDAIVKDAPADVHKMIVDIVSRMVAGK